MGGGGSIIIKLMKTKMTCLYIAALALLVPIASVLAAGRTEAPVLESKTNWLAIVYVLAATALICVVGFKKSGRTHLD